MTTNPHRIIISFFFFVSHTVSPKKIWLFKHNKQYQLAYRSFNLCLVFGSFKLKIRCEKCWMVKTADDVNVDLIVCPKLSLTIEAKKKKLYSRKTRKCVVYLFYRTCNFERFDSWRNFITFFWSGVCCGPCAYACVHGGHGQLASGNSYKYRYTLHKCMEIRAILIIYEMVFFRFSILIIIFF